MILSEGRCECASRIFVNRQVVITTSSGSIRDIPSMMLLECVRCARTYTVSTDPGQKVLIQFKAGMEGEKLLFQEALKSWKNGDRHASQESGEANQSHIVLDDADKKDFERLGVS